MNSNAFDVVRNDADQSDWGYFCQYIETNSTDKP